MLRSDTTHPAKPAASSDDLRGDVAVFERKVGGAADWGIWLGLVAVLSLIYGALINPYWVMAGDGETYLGIARNLAQGEGFRHNGQPVGLVPPGWPWLLALGMQVTDRFDLLKLIPAAFAVGFFATSYWVCRRYVGRALAASACLLVGVTYPTVQLSFWFFSDLPFCFFCAVAFLLAHRINEATWAEASGWWRRGGEPVLLALTMIAAVSVRWNGVLLPAIVGAILVSGERLWWPRLNFRWLTAIVTGLICLASFLVLRQVMKVDEANVDPRYPQHLVGTYEYINSYEGEYTIGLVGGRFSQLGRWFSGTLWEPLYAMRSYVRVTSNLMGWAVIFGLLVWAVRETRHRRYWLLGALCFWLPVAVTWPHPMPRYLLPTAPLLIAAAVCGLWPIARGVVWPIVAAWRVRRDATADRDAVDERSRTLGRRWALAGAIVFFAGTFFGNGLLLAMEIYVQRSTPFYEHVDGGVHRNLNDIGKYLAEHATAEEGIGVSYVRRRNGRYLERLGWAWAVNWLTDRPVQVIPGRLSVDPEAPGVGDELAAWMRARDLRWYVWQPPYHARYHFRGGGITRWWQAGADLGRIGEIWTNQPKQATAQDWQLWERHDGELHRVRVPNIENWPTRIPQLHERPRGRPYPGTLWPGGEPRYLDAEGNPKGWLQDSPTLVRPKRE